MYIDNFPGRTRAFVKIQDGCENFCSYCLIPYARGKIKSRDPENVIEEINSLVKLGTKEIIIAGINTGTYGQDLGNINLAKLIEKIMEEDKCDELLWADINDLPEPFINYEGKFLENKMITTYDCLADGAYEKNN